MAGTVAQLERLRGDRHRERRVLSALALLRHAQLVVHLGVVRLMLRRMPQPQRHAVRRHVPRQPRAPRHALQRRAATRAAVAHHAPQLAPRPVDHEGNARAAVHHLRTEG